MAYMTIDDLIQAFKANNYVTNFNAARILEMIGTFSVAPLVDALHNDNYKVRKNAAWALGFINDREALQALAVSLQDENTEVRARVAKELGFLKASAAVPALIEQVIMDRDKYVKANAAWSLGEIGDVLALDALTILLENPSEYVALHAAEALGKLKDARAIKPLIKSIDGERSKRYKSTVIEALGNIGDILGTIYLIRTLNHDDLELRAAAAWALGKVREPWFVKYLSPLLSDSEQAVRVNAVWALGQIGGPQAFHMLVQAMQDDNRYVRREAAQAIARLTDKSQSSD